MSAVNGGLTPAIDPQLDEILAHPPRVAGAALGYVGLDIPPDLLLASSRESRHLPWRTAGDTPHADAWLESSFPIWARTMIEDWATGRFDSFADVVFTRGEDVSQRLYYYVCELQRQGKLAGPRPHVFDIARIKRPASQRYTEASLRQLAQQLSLTEEDLRRGITRANALRADFHALNAHRQGRGSRYERLVRASLFADVRPLISRCQEDRGRSDAATEVVAERGRVVIAGSSPPDERIHRVIEGQGWRVSGELYDRSLDRLGEPVPETEADPAASIARHWLRHTFLGRSFQDAERRLLERVHQGQAHAVVLWFAREDEGLAWQIPRLRQVLQRARIPVLVLSARAWDFEDGAEQEVHAFLTERAR